MHKLGVPRLRGGSSDSDTSGDSDKHIINHAEGEANIVREESSQNVEIDRRI